MKRILLSTLSLFCFSLISFKANAAITKLIVLDGNFTKAQTRDVTSSLLTSTTDEDETTSSIEAYSTTSGVYTTFSSDLGYVLIQIISTETGEVVYSTYVDSGSEDSFIAPDGYDLTSGEYYISYTTVYGEVTGDL